MSDPSPPAAPEWKNMNIIGIDPGKSGGIAFLPHNGRTPWHTKMPETERDVWDLLKECCAWSEGGGLKAFIEDVHAMPKQGVTSTFTFGVGLGGLRMALIGLDVPFEKVSPMKWQKALGCMSKGNKNVTKRKAQELFPAAKVTHAVADALLIAEYGRRTEGA